MKTVKLSEIIIADAFASTVPSEQKMNRVRDYIKANGKQDKSIVINKNGILVDGYIRYLVLKEMGYESANVKVLGGRKPYNNLCAKREDKHSRPSYRKSLTTYIYGVHKKKDGKLSKEYMWRIPPNQTGYEDLLPGDTVMVNTKYGRSPITITKIEWLRECPVGRPVKKVVGKTKQIKC